MRWYSVAVAALVSACGDTAVVVHVDGDLAVPEQIDAMCLAVYDRDPGGGQFARRYLLAGELAALPQTLTVTPGAADDGVAVVRGYLGGVEVARDRRAFEFSGGVDDLTLQLLQCAPGSDAAPRIAGSAPGSAAARLAASAGRGGTLLVVIDGADSAAYRASGSALSPVAGALPEAAAAFTAPAVVLALDADGDCDDDLVVADAGAAALWLREGDAFAPAPSALPVAGARAAAAADIDGDGDLDLAFASGGVVILRNDGAGRFQVDAGAAPPGAAPDATVLAFADFDGDGHVDLVVGQGSAAPGELRALYNDGAGTGAFQLVDAALPPVAMQARALAVADVAGTGAPDLLVAAADGPVRAYVNRGDGRLDDRSFVALPTTELAGATGLAAGDWDGDCLADVAVAVGGAQVITWRGTDAGALVDETAPAATAAVVVMADLDDDGARDVAVAGGDGGVVWLRR